MKIDTIQVTVKDVFEGFKDEGENGVKGYGGMLDIRPPFQREFVYNSEKQIAVLNTIKQGFPLNVMYWVKNNQGEYEVLDGQQRTLSFCQFLAGETSDENGNLFISLPSDIQEKILNYSLMVYVCEGTESEKLAWFRTINIAGEKLTEQELRNAMYTGPWLLDAKKHFSATNCAGANLGDDIVKYSTIRQELLEKVLEWKIDQEGINTIEEYMSRHQYDADAQELWGYYQDVMNWVHKVFPRYHEHKKIMINQKWGQLYNQYHNEFYNPNELEDKIKELLKNDEVQNKKGIVEYIFDGKEKHLNLRAFTKSQKLTAYENQNGICSICGEHYEYEQMEGDHITPWIEGGKTVQENCQMLCKECNRRKGSK